MATVYVNIGTAGANGSASHAPIRQTTTKSCDAFTSSTSAAYVQSGSADVTLSVGDLIEVSTDGNVVVRFDGVATTTNGHRVATNNTTRPEPFQCSRDGQKISIIDQ